MTTFKTRGLVLREYEAGESDKRLLILCKIHGRIMAYARGARNPRSKFIAASQLFTYADFVLAQGRGFFSVTQAEVIENFYNLRTDYDRLIAAHLLVEVCEKTLLENSNCDELLLLALRALSNLSKGVFPPTQITSVFLMRFFDFYGLKPNISNCIICNHPTQEMSDGIYLGAEGIVCATHKAQEKTAALMPISKAAARAITHIFHSGMAQSFLFNTNQNVLRELERASNLLWDTHFEWGLKSRS